MAQHVTQSNYFDREFGTAAVKIVAGEFFATADATAISTVLGSCVSVCLYDKASGIGGMNHYMLPEQMQGTCAADCGALCLGSGCARYGNCAMRRLLARLEELGADPRRLEAKLFGAGRVMAGVTDIGAQNASFALRYLEQRRIPVVASDLGESWPRKVIFFPATGRAFVRRILELRGGGE
jgi:chemotaxis protein CheD